MNEITHPTNLSDVPWPTSDTRPRLPDPSVLPGSDKAAPTVGLLKNAVQGAHTTLDRLADRAEPAVRHLGETVTSAEQALHAKTHQLRVTGDAWAEGMRTTVRSNPLVWVAAAFALGAVIVRITR